MKILLTGGGTGGHFYPIIAIVEQINSLMREWKLMEAKIYFMSDGPYDSKMLYENNIKFLKAPAGKRRRYFSLLNITDVFKTAWGIVKSVILIFSIYPDVVFGKGGYASFPALFAARLLRIPVIIHESDSTPGKVSLWASKFARRIAISYPESADFFPKDKVAYTGNPVRSGILGTGVEGAYQYLKLEEGIPILLIIGGSLGAKTINDIVMTCLPDLVKNYQIIHQTGRIHFNEVNTLSKAILLNNSNKDRYKCFDYIDDLGMRMAASVASLVISRAGSAIFEIAAWGIPSIIIPITDSNGDHQRKNAFNYARTGAAIVIEEINLNASIFTLQIDHLIQNTEKLAFMKQQALQFAKLDAANKIARQILEIALEHEN
jgi:UDP-N-acetylglucosamine--N-acetylmuramyl-(pentapeptide) pyrophosphoryl-undecaprenol N-acetylglucosamine transferase